MHILAHQGGWDEILMVAGPLAVFAGLMWQANRRAEEVARDRPEITGEDPEEKPPSEGSMDPEPA